MTITKTEYTTLKTAALKAAETVQQITDICNSIENRTKEASKKTSLYIMEKRKTNKFYCR